MYNNKGVTLVELLAILVILALIFTIVIPSGSSILKKNNVQSAKINYNKIDELIRVEMAKILDDTISNFTIEEGQISYMLGTKKQTIKFEGNLDGIGAFYIQDNKNYGYYLENNVCVYKGKLSNGELKIKQQVTILSECSNLYNNEN